MEFDQQYGSSDNGAFSYPVWIYAPLLATENPQREVIHISASSNTTQAAQANIDDPD